MIAAETAVPKEQRTMEDEKWKQLKGLIEESKFGYEKGNERNVILLRKEIEIKENFSSLTGRYMQVKGGNIKLLFSKERKPRVLLRRKRR